MKETINEIKKARFYALMIDETRDISGKEQLAFVIRYVTPDFTVTESLIGSNKIRIQYEGRSQEN